MSEFASAAQIALPQAATLAAPGTAASSAVSAARGLASSVSTFPNIGLSMRFIVEVTGSNFGRVNLGGWTSCEGLKVEFKYDTIRSGGDYGNPHILPQHISFSPVTLKRAVERPYSQRVQLWLTQVATEWTQGPGEPNIGTTVTISLLDVYQNDELPAAQWQLQNAFPVAWSGPSMNAKSNEIAYETLVLEHEGFLVMPA